MMRAATIPSKEFEKINVTNVIEICSQFYILFEQLFGETNCTYNLHVICCHLLEIRTHGPLTQTSAFKFETFYGEMRRAFTPGTSSTLKQILKNVLLARVLRKHRCQNDIYISNYDTSLESNRIIYAYEKNEYHIYQISDINGKLITCNKIGKYPAIFEETPNINWSHVGVFRKGGVSSDVTILNSSQICGKVIIVGKYLITCANNILREKWKKNVPIIYYMKNEKKMLQTFSFLFFIK